VASLPKLRCHSPAERLRNYVAVEPGAGCRVWLKYLTPHGYGLIGMGHGQARLAHRVSWELANGPIPPGLCVLHRCDNRACVNPDHLFLGTRTENNADRHAKGRSRNGSSPKESLLHPSLPLMGKVAREARRMGRRREPHPSRADARSTLPMKGRGIACEVSALLRRRA
jgi:hypothetical protein